jgi:hypothetical protein
VSFYVSTATFFLLHCDVVALPRHKFVTGATLLQLGIRYPNSDIPTEIVYWSRVMLRNLYYFIPRFSGVGILFTHVRLSTVTWSFKNKKKIQFPSECRSSSTLFEFKKRRAIPTALKKIGTSNPTRNCDEFLATYATPLELLMPVQPWSKGKTWIIGKGDWCLGSRWTFLMGMLLCCGIGFVLCVLCVCVTSGDFVLSSCH